VKETRYRSPSTVGVIVSDPRCGPIARTQSRAQIQIRRLRLTVEQPLELRLGPNKHSVEGTVAIRDLKSMWLELVFSFLSSVFRLR